MRGKARNTLLRRQEVMMIRNKCGGRETRRKWPMTEEAVRYCTKIPKGIHDVKVGDMSSRVRDMPKIGGCVCKNDMSKE